MADDQRAELLKRAQLIQKAKAIQAAQAIPTAGNSNLAAFSDAELSTELSDPATTDPVGVTMGGLAATGKALDVGRGALTAPALAAALGALTGRDVYRGQEHLDAVNPLNLNSFPSANELYERAGVPEGATLSDYIPGYADPSPDSPWYRPEKGGLLDWSVRGAGGFATDSVIDPLNYLSAGAAGAGKTAIKESAQEMALRAPLTWAKNPLRMTVNAGGDAVNAVTRATGAQEAVRRLGATKAGRMAVSASQAPSKLMGKVGERIYRNMIQPVEDLGQVFNKDDVAGALYRGHVSNPLKLRSEANNATDLYLQARNQIAERAGATASFDLDQAFAEVEAEVARLLKSPDPVDHDKAALLAAKMQTYYDANPKEVLKKAIPDIPEQRIPGRAAEYAVSRPGTPDQVIPGVKAEYAVDPEFVGKPLTKTIPDLPAGQATAGMQPEFVATRGDLPQRGVYDKAPMDPDTGKIRPETRQGPLVDMRQVVPEIPSTPGEAAIPGEIRNLGKDYGFRQIIPEIPEEVIPGVAPEWRQVAPEIAEEVIPAVPGSPAVLGARPRITPRQGFDMTSNLYNQTTTGAWSEYLKTPEGQKAAKKLAAGTRGETLASIKRALGEKVAKGAEDLNADAGAILATRKAQQTLQNQANRTANAATSLTGTDKLMTSVGIGLGDPAAAAKALAAGKAMDSIRSRAMMPLGYYTKRASENQILAPILDMAGRQGYVGLTERGSREERKNNGRINGWSNGQ